jgi:hypothetical protein
MDHTHGPLDFQRLPVLTNVKGVSVMKDEEVNLKIEEIESSHTLGGAGEVIRGEGRGGL